MDNKSPRLRWFPLFVGIFIAATFSWITPWNNIVYHNSPLGGSHFPVAPFGLLLILSILGNGILGRFFPRLRLHAEELLYLWISSALSVTLSYTGFARTFLLNISWHPEGVRKDLFVGPLLFANDHLSKSILQGAQGGEKIGFLELLKVIPWSDWFQVMGIWMLFVIFVFISLIGIASIFSHQWLENERMPLPLLYIPRVFSEEAERSSLLSSLKNAFFLTGITIPILIHTINGLATYIPNIPQIPTLFLAQPYVSQEGLLKGFAKLKIYIYPAFMGFAYLVPRQISLSVWFFFLLGFLMPGVLGLFGMAIPDIALGTTFGPGVARVEETQMIGAYGICALFILWLSRYHIRGLIFDPLYLTKDVEYSGLFHPRVGIFLFLLGYLLMVLWLIFFGVDAAVAVLFLIICLMLQIVITKMVCQGGLPYFTLPVAPSDGFLAFVPTKVLSPVSVYLGVVIQKLAFLDVRESLLPTIVHASAIKGSLSSDRNRFLLGLGISIIVSLGVSILCMLVIYYKYGASSLPDTWALETVSSMHEKALSLIKHPETPKFWVTFYVLVGALVMVVLIWGYRHFVWWPFHPMGYLMMYNSATQIIWFSFFIGWLSNKLIFHYGGFRTYESVRWFFVGLIVGDVLMALVWIIVGVFSSVAYHVFPL
ncbi:MAG: hypothetical protein N2260_09700 [Syntrophobacterales bacterium]|nr:hypothetical protein [Syntrophobacterales bacterium]